MRDIKFSNFERKFLECRKSNDNEAALSLIFRAANYVASNRLHVGQALFFRQLDSCLKNICQSSELKKQFAGQFLPRPKEDAVVIASEVYSAGGHGQIIKRLSSAINSHLIFTDPFFRCTYDSKAEVPNNIGINFSSVCTLSGRTHVTKIYQCLEFLEKLNPGILFLVGHHQDVVPIAVGLMFAEARRTVFLHHADHLPSLGASINFPVHYDFRSEIRSICGKYLERAHVLPTPVSEFGGRVKAPGERIVLATSGTFIKFEGNCGGISYPDVVLKILSCEFVEKYVHIGEISGAVLSSIQSGISQNEKMHKKFVRVDRVPSVAEYLVQEGINGYIASFPTTGAMAAAEAQSVGCPVIYPDDTLAPSLCESESLYPSKVLSWSDLPALRQVIWEVGVNWGCFSEEALAHYRTRNSSECFKREIERIKNMLAVNL